MKQDVSYFKFRQAFKDYDREDNFSYAGLSALYDYIIDYEVSCGTEIELDVIALCCEFTEYGDIEEVKKNYYDIEDIEDLRNNTTVIEFDSGIIIQDY